LLPQLNVLVVDGCSGDRSAAEIESFCTLSEFKDWVDFVPLAVNGGFGWANNQAILLLTKRATPPDFVYLLNPDAEIEAGALLSLVNYLKNHDRVGAVGSQLVNPDGTLAGSAFSFPSVRGEFSRGARTGLIDRLLRVPSISIEVTEARLVDWVTGGSVLLRVDALQQTGLFDDGFFLYNEEVELMWRLHKHGWLVATEPSSRVRHLGGAATGVGRSSARLKLARRLPRYIYRSRSRFFGLTQGFGTAIAAYLAWIAGSLFWWMRRLLGLAKGAPIDHQLRDHLFAAFPRLHDTEASIATLDSEPGEPPAWMKNQWQ
jgi:GT2 family glycosyltransferase